MKTVKLSITEFALPAPRVGSIDVYSGMGRAQSTGIELHQKVQKARTAEHSDYAAEVELSHTFEREDYRFEISGRADGVFSGALKIEEIKSSFNIYELLRNLKEAGDTHPYVLQLRTYGYFHWVNTQEKPELSLHLISSRNEETLDLRVALDPAGYERWLDARLNELVVESRAAEKRVKRRQKAARALTFPFAQPRVGQTELIQTIEEGMREQRPMLIQAPTGLGKTIGVLYPTLKEALARGQKVIYVTPKNSQHSVAEDAIERLQEAGAPLKGMTLTAKSKMCFKNEPICNPEYCEFARDHYTKIAENNLAAELAKKRALTAKTFKKMAEEYEVCPFELQLEAAVEADALICDYNYAFAPHSLLSRISENRLDQSGLPNLVIDEAHNLPARAMDYYSPALSIHTLESMREDLKRLPGRFRVAAGGLLDSCISVVKQSAPADCKAPCPIDPPAGAFQAQDAELREFLSAYLSSTVEIQPGDPVLRLCFYWSEFTDALEFVSRDRDAFFTTYNPNPPTVRITCCDASALLKERYKEYEQVVGFSATLKPFDFYSQLTGLHTQNLKTAEFVSPFPQERRKVIAIPQISSKYSERERNYPKIADAIHRIAQLKRGNYFCFFPSFEFLARVLEAFSAPDGFEVLCQERRMSRPEIDAVIDRLRETNGAHIVFAVQGGVFSEGIDYPGDMVIGAFVVGPPLPHFNLERETMRGYYQKHYASGFDYAYTYPAMAKAVQAAGRVIRSETDRGIIVLMDDRFVHTSYAKSMPRDWFADSPHEMVSRSILADITQFWTALDETPH